MEVNIINGTGRVPVTEAALLITDPVSIRAITTTILSAMSAVVIMVGTFLDGSRRNSRCHLAGWRARQRLHTGSALLQPR